MANLNGETMAETLSKTSLFDIDPLRVMKKLGLNVPSESDISTGIRTIAEIISPAADIKEMVEGSEKTSEGNIIPGLAQMVGGLAGVFVPGSAKIRSASKKLEDVVNTGTTVGKNNTFRSDIPSEKWLQNKIEYVESKGKNKYGHNYIATDTGNFKNYVTLPVRELKKIKGASGEQRNISQSKIDPLLDYMNKTGKLPPGVKGEEYVPFITVDHKGIPVVSEGNHRIMAAAKLGWENIPVQLRYFEGGERRATGIFDPVKILQEGKAKTIKRVKLSNSEIKKVKH